VTPGRALALRESSADIFMRLFLAVTDPRCG